MAMTVEEAWERITYRGDSVFPVGEEHDLRLLTAEVVSRLPEEVQEWFLDETHHVFIGGYGQLGEFMPLFFFPDDLRDQHDGMAIIRVIFLSEKLMSVSREEALFTIAHEIAHSRCRHELPTGRCGPDDEGQADALVAAWGFQVPAERADLREHSYGPRRPQ